MAQPLPYERDFDFAGFQSTHPSTPLPGDKVNLEFDQVAETFDQIRERIRILQRDDLELANTSVGWDQLKPELRNGFSTPTVWAAGIDYQIGASVYVGRKVYAALVAHKSVNFGVDLASGKWYLLADFTEVTKVDQSAVEAAQQAIAAAAAAQGSALAAAQTVAQSAANAQAAQNSAVAAAASQTAAATSASQAGISATNAASSASAASTSASNAASSATAAAGSESAAASSEATATAAATTATNAATTATNAATTATDAASSALTNAGAAASSASSAQLDANRAEAAAIATEFWFNIATRDAVETNNIPSAANYIRTAGFSVEGDGGAALYRRVASEPVSANKINNGDFSSDTGWVKGTGWAIASGKATHATGASSAISQAVAFVADRKYRVTFTVSDRTTGTVTPQFLDGTAFAGTARASNGTFTQEMTAKPGNARFALSASADFNGSIDAVSVSQVLTLSAIRSADGAWWEITGKTANVLGFGASPLGVTDCTQAVQGALEYIASRGGGEVYFPAGDYLFNDGLLVGDGSNKRLALTIRGDGPAVRLFHSADAPLFKIWGNCTDFSARDFEVWPDVDQVDPTKGVFYAPNGLSRATFSSIQGQQSGSDRRLSSFFYTEAGAPMDEITFTDIIEVHNTAGFRLGSGSSVWFIGGRSIGNYPGTVCKGLELTGGMGGVFVWGTDFIGNHTNVQVSAASGVSNRELFLSHACFDGGYRGLHITDESYVSIVGCWAASADQACIECSFSGNGGVLNISGGTVYNAGVVSLNAGDKIGVIFGGLGRIDMSGVTVRENRNRGLYLTNPARTQFSNIRANNFYSNGTSGTNPCDIFVSGAAVVENNTITNGIIRGSGNTIIRNNVGDVASITTPTIPASGTPITNQTGRTVEVFISGGTVSQITKRGVPVFSSSNVSLLLQPGDAIAVTYTAAPTWSWVLP